MPVWLQIAVVVAPIVTIVGVAVRITRLLERLDRRLQNIELRIATVEFQNRALLKAFPQVVSSLITGHIVTTEQGTQMISTALDSPPIAEFLRTLRPTENPLSQADVDRLRNYVDRLKFGQMLTPDEARDFYRLTDTVTREYPGNEGTWLLFLIGGILLGAMLSTSK